MSITGDALDAAGETFLAQLGTTEDDDNELLAAVLDGATAIGDVLLSEFEEDATVLCCGAGCNVVRAVAEPGWAAAARATLLALDTRKPQLRPIADSLRWKEFPVAYVREARRFLRAHLAAGHCVTLAFQVR